MIANQPELLSLARDWLRPHVRPRRFHAFGIGMPKTGTQSLAAIFSGYRAWHEPAREEFMQIIMARANGALTETTTRDAVRRLDRRMWLELNSSWINYMLLDILLEAYPRAKFVLTLRDCYSWADSIWNEILGRVHDEYQVQFQRWYGESLSPGTHVEGDRVLAEHGVWPLDMWLRAWHQHTRRVLATVPAERLLVIRIQDLHSELPRLAEFLGVPVETLDARRSHEHKAAAKFGLLAKIDPQYLHERVEARCGDLMRTFFPDIQSPAAVTGLAPKQAQSA